MFTRTLRRTLMVILFIVLVGVIPLFGQPGTPAAPVVEAALNCTFTASFPAVNLRSGPGTEYDITDQLANGDTLAVIDQSAGKDGFVWWKSVDGWVRSDMGTSDCPSTCGNTVCEYGENATSCAQDCSSKPQSAATANSTTNLVSTGEGCFLADSQSCYESVDCWPDCNVCTSWLNAFGCVTCQCEEPTTSDTTTGSGCDFATCEDCIAAFPCFPGPCTQTECTLNEFGCPVCTTSG